MIRDTTTTGDYYREGTVLPYWRLQAVAAPDDSRWLDYAKWKEVIVRADTAAEARMVASVALGRAGERLGNESPADRTGLEDEKLYLATRVDAEHAEHIELEESEEMESPIIRAIPMHD